MLVGLGLPAAPRRIEGQISDIGHTNSQLEVRAKGAARGPTVAFIRHVQGAAPQVLLGQRITLRDYSGEGFSSQTIGLRESRTLVSHSASGAHVHVFQGKPTAPVTASQGVVFQFTPGRSV